MSVGFLLRVVDAISLVNLAVRLSMLELRSGAKQICACTVEDNLPVKLNQQAKFQLYCSHIPVLDQTTTSNYKNLRMGWSHRRIVINDDTKPSTDTSEIKISHWTKCHYLLDVSTSVQIGLRSLALLWESEVIHRDDSYCQPWLVTVCANIS
jgi:hypothetical protein